MGQKNSLLLLCHSGGWDRLYQALSAATAAATAGGEATVVFFFGALNRLASGRLDAVELEPRQAEAESALAARIDEVGVPELSQLLAAGRRTGRLRLLACSASTALMGLEKDRVAEVVDEIVGWPTVVLLMRESDQVLYL